MGLPPGSPQHYVHPDSTPSFTTWPLAVGTHLGSLHLTRPKSPGGPAPPPSGILQGGGRGEEGGGGGSAGGLALGASSRGLTQSDGTPGNQLEGPAPDRLGWGFVQGKTEATDSECRGLHCCLGCPPVPSHHLSSAHCSVRLFQIQFLPQAPKPAA